MQMANTDTADSETAAAASATAAEERRAALFKTFGACQHPFKDTIVVDGVPISNAFTTLLPEFACSNPAHNHHKYCEAHRGAKNNEKRTKFKSLLTSRRYGRKQMSFVDAAHEVLRIKPEIMQGETHYINELQHENL